jgi:hypothetical protein
MSERAAAAHFGISRAGVKKIMGFSVPPCYRRTAEIRRPKLDGFIDQWLLEDHSPNRKQRHTAKRVFERLTTHRLEDAAIAWRVVGPFSGIHNALPGNGYRQRWHIEQFFRSLKQQGLQLEDSQLETAERLIKLTAIAARAACTIIQLVQARDGRAHRQLPSLTFGFGG